MIVCFSGKEDVKGEHWVDINMAVASATLSLSLHLLPIPKPKTTFTISSHRPLLAFHSPNLSTPHYLHSSPISAVKISSGLGNYLISEAASTPETTQELVATSSPGVSNIIQTLLFVAFVGLSILTVGVSDLMFLFSERLDFGNWVVLKI